MNKLVLLIPHYDNPKGLLVSLASIGCNENLDVLIVDDGSNNKFDEIEVKMTDEMRDRNTAVIKLKFSVGGQFESQELTFNIEA